MYCSIDFVPAVIIGLVGGVLVGVLISSVIQDVVTKDKRELLQSYEELKLRCEIVLPRNQYCTLQAVPEQEGK